MNPIQTLKDMGDNAPKLALICTGAGPALQEDVWGVPGISKFFIGGRMPYEMQDTDSILGFTPDLGPRGKPEYVSLNTAVDLSMAAYMLAWRPGKRAIGIGMTCSVASETEHRGDHRVMVAAFTENACYTICTVIPKGVGAEQRAADDRLAADIALYLLTVILGGSLREPLPGLGLKVESHMDLAKQRILARPFFRADGTRGTLSDIVPSETIFYPGAYNPPHKGHHGAAKASMKVHAGVCAQYRELVYTTTITHPIKDPLTPAEMLQRAAMMRNAGHRCNFLLTEGDGRYLDKARRFPGACFILGADALDRMLDPSWGVETSALVKELDYLNAWFFVPGRLVDGTFLTCQDVLKKWNITNDGTIFIPVDYRMDLSSTEIREGSKQA